MKKTLSRRLRELEQCGIVARTAASSAPPDAEWALTSERCSPAPALAAAWTWSRERAAASRCAIRSARASGRRSRAPSDKRCRRRRTGR
ncbi:winged helix-turn-helix transcriptional regulator [Streptomyces sp. NPDC059209]|uniref:winged helix-turn-helix transcriptional regulator n=1 Tax=Streptomyces sp. NPDC059209 TaxID=3346769 RepID=UPI003687E988